MGAVKRAINLIGQGAKAAGVYATEHIPFVGDKVYAARERKRDDAVRESLTEKKATSSAALHERNKLGYDTLQKMIGELGALEYAEGNLRKYNVLGKDELAKVDHYVSGARSILEGAIEHGQREMAVYAHKRKRHGGDRSANYAADLIERSYATGAILILAGALGMIAFTATNVTGAVVGAPISDFNVVAASVFAVVAVVGVLISLRK